MNYDQRQMVALQSGSPTARTRSLWASSDMPARAKCDTCGETWRARAVVNGQCRDCDLAAESAEYDDPRTVETHVDGPEAGPESYVAKPCPACHGTGWIGSIYEEGRGDHGPCERCAMPPVDGN